MLVQVCLYCMQLSHVLTCTIQVGCVSESLCLRRTCVCVQTQIDVNTKCVCVCVFVHMQYACQCFIQEHAYLKVL